MIIEVPTLGISQTVVDWKLTKELTDNRINRNLEANVQFKGDAYKLLLQETLTGKGLDNATFTEKCDTEDIVIACNILHNEGQIKNNSCFYKKKVFIKDPLTCLKDLEANIFDYEAKSIRTIQGLKEDDDYYTDKQFYFQPNEVPQLQNLIDGMGGIPEKGNGWYITYIQVTCYPIIETITEDGNTFTQYNGSQARLHVHYNRLKSTVKYSEFWVLIPGSTTEYYFTKEQPITWAAPVYTPFIAQDSNTLNYVGAEFVKGKVNLIVEKEISNSINFNKVLEGLFTCSGLTLVSNFFGINSDNTQPANDVYEYALEYMQDLYICQSYDIIREQALEDSFGNSGKFKAKKAIESICALFNQILSVDVVANKIRLEHSTYYMNKGLDFTTNGKAYGIDDTLEVNKDLISSEQWRMAAITPNSYESKITYDVIGETLDKEYQIEYFLTDVFGTINNKEFETSEYKKLFYLLQTDGDNIIGLNTGLDLNNIISKLHYYNRVLPRGIHDGKDVQFNGFSYGITTKMNYDGSLKDFLKLSPANTVKTALGTFMITSIEINNKGTIKMNIKK